MIDQVINMHPNVPYFHIGCDEVYYKLFHPSCRNENGTLFNGDFQIAFLK